MVLIAGEQFPDNEACLTCVHVLAGSPIFLVARDEDGDWQFLCSRPHDGTDARVIALGEVVSIEPRLSSLTPLGRNATTRLPA